MSNVNEKYPKQISALRTLLKLGYTYLPAQNLKSFKKQVLLEDILAIQLRNLNGIFHRKKKYPLSGENVSLAIGKLRSLFSSPISRVNEKIYDVITTPQPCAQLIAGKLRKFGLVYIDWMNWENNVYHCTFDYFGKRKESQREIILYINGIPLAILPCTSPENESINEIFQQGSKYLPNLSSYIQLLFCDDKPQGKQEILLQNLAKLNLLFKESTSEMYNFEIENQTLKVCEEASTYIADIIEKNLLNYPKI